MIADADPRAWRRAAGVAVLGVLGLATAALLAGWPVETAWPWSSMVSVDGAWRVSRGQIPHTDFHSPIGFGYLWLSGLFMRWSASPAALIQASVVWGALVALTTWLATARRLSPSGAAIATLCAAALAISFTTFGSAGSDELSFAGQYSRIGWALFLPIGLALLVPPRPAGRARAAGEWALVGSCLGAAFAAKFTYALGGALLLPVAMAIGSLRGRDALWLAGGAVAMVAALALAAGVNLGHYVADLRQAARSPTESTVGLLVHQVLESDVWLTAGLLVGAWWTRAALLTRGTGWRRLLPLGGAALAAAWAMGIGLSAINGSEPVSPGLVLTLLVFAGWVAGSEHGRWPALLALVLVAAFTWRQAVPVVQHAAQPGHGGPGTLTDAGPMSGIDVTAGARRDLDRPLAYLTRNNAGITGTAYRRWLLDGLELIRPVLKPGQTVVVLDFANPFPFILGCDSPRGDVLYWHYGRNVADRTAPPVAPILDQAGVVLVPKQALMHEAVTGKWQLFQPELERRFHRTGGNDTFDRWEPR